MMSLTSIRPISTVSSCKVQISGWWNSTRRGVAVGLLRVDDVPSFELPFRVDCRNLAPEWKRVATALKGIVKVGAVDADTHKSLGQQYGVSGFPSLKIFGTNKYSPINLQGGRTADAIVEQALTQLRTIVNDRLGGKRGGGGSSGSSGGGSGGKDTIELTDSNFEVNHRLSFDFNRRLTFLSVNGH